MKCEFTEYDRLNRKHYIKHKRLNKGIMKNIYCIYDSKAEAYMSPWFVDKDGQALREFQDVIRNPDSPFAKHPEDYTLFKIGTYDQDTAKLSSLDTPVSMGVGIEYINTGLEAVQESVQ